MHIASNGLYSGERVALIPGPLEQNLALQHESLELRWQREILVEIMKHIRHSYQDHRFESWPILRQHET
jgi:hypothetical protein